MKCLSSSSDCPTAHYSIDNIQYPGLTTNGKLCKPCNDACATCDGPSTNDCLSCSSAIVLDQQANFASCLPSCPQTTLPNNQTCRYCHTECNGCYGPTSADCVACRGASMINSNGQTVCTPSCNSNEFLFATPSGEFICLPCHSECNGCTGPSNSDCTKCKNFNNTFIGENECTSLCPYGTYADGQNECTACHAQCTDCTGPGSSNCTGCLEDSMNSDGVSICVPTCPVWQLYDISKSSCALTE